MSSTNESNSSQRKNVDQQVSLVLEQLVEVEERMRNRCDAIDVICRQLMQQLNIDEYLSSISNEETVDCGERVEVFDNYEMVIRSCSEGIAELVLEKVKEKNQNGNVGEKMREILKKMSGLARRVLSEIFFPIIIEGKISC
jgi:hypothetical protein